MGSFFRRRSEVTAAVFRGSVVEEAREFVVRRMPMQTRQSSSADAKAARARTPPQHALTHGSLSSFFRRDQPQL